MRTIMLIQIHLYLFSSFHFIFEPSFSIMKFLAISSIAALLVAQQVAAYPFIEGCLQNHTGN